MKSKTEIKLDKEFKRLGMKPRVYHFRAHTTPFNAVTIADVQSEPWELIEAILNRAISAVENHSNNKATLLLTTLQQDRIYGVAICDKRDQFNRQRGRIIAKGRLLKHLNGENRK